MGLREKKKREAKERILKSAEKIFVSEGYTKATTARIARDAEVGEGTIYNYFGSKSDILIAIFKKTFDDDFITNPVILKDGESAEDYFFQYVDILLLQIKEINKEWMREIFSIMLKEDRSKIQKDLFDFDHQFIQGIISVLDILKETGQIKKEVELECVIDIYYSLLMNHFIAYIVGEIDYQVFCKKVKSRFKFVWLTMLASS